MRHFAEFLRFQKNSRRLSSWQMSNASPRHKYISRCIQVVLITSNCFSWLSIFFRRVSHICFKAAQSSLALECHTYPDNFSQTKLRPMKWEKAFFAIANTLSFKKHGGSKSKVNHFWSLCQLKHFLKNEVVILIKLFRSKNYTMDTHFSQPVNETSILMKKISNNIDL